MATTLSVKGLAITGAVFWGVYLGLAALVASVNVSLPWFSPNMFGMLMDLYPGLAPSVVGVFVGLLWGALCGAVCGAILAWLYNWASASYD